MLRMLSRSTLREEAAAIPKDRVLANVGYLRGMILFVTTLVNVTAEFILDRNTHTLSLRWKYLVVPGHPYDDLRFHAIFVRPYLL